MKALILNSGMGTRMGVLTSEQPKCMTEVSATETILSRQLRQIAYSGIKQVVITTGYFDKVLENYCEQLDLPLEYTFVKNPVYDSTNYIYSIYCAREYLDDDILLMHGDLVFENSVFDSLLEFDGSAMAVSTTAPLPQKDFKAVLCGGKIGKVGIEFFENAVAAQPLYKLRRADWKEWLENITAFCESGEQAKLKCYAENALNEVSHRCEIKPFDVGTSLCAEIDDPVDLEKVSAALKKAESTNVYMSFSVDMLHSGHIAIIKKAARLGRLTIGVLTDEAVASYKKAPLMPFEERRSMFESIKGVYRVVAQNTLSYKENIEKYRPDIVVHGDDWESGLQKPVRDEAAALLARYGARLVEFPYAKDEKYKKLDSRTLKSSEPQVSARVCVISLGEDTDRSLDTAMQRARSADITAVRSDDIDALCSFAQRFKARTDAPLAAVCTDISLSAAQLRSFGFDTVLFAHSESSETLGRLISAQSLELQGYCTTSEEK